MCYPQEHEYVFTVTEIGTTPDDSEYIVRFEPYGEPKDIHEENLFSFRLKNCQDNDYAHNVAEYLNKHVKIFRIDPREI
jgi:hypothetical protein